MKCRKAEYSKLLKFVDETTLFLAEKSAEKVPIPLYTDKTIYQTSHENDSAVTGFAEEKAKNRSYQT